MSRLWYALICRQNKEEIILHQLKAQGFEVFFPRRMEYTKNHNYIKVKPLFPGYLFVRVDLDSEALSTFQRMQFTNGLTCYGGKPVFLPDNMIQAIRSRVERINTSIGKFFAGVDHNYDTAQSDQQPRGYEAIFDGNLSDKERMLLLLEVFGGTIQEESVSVLRG